MRYYGTLLERFAQKVEATATCWWWRGAIGRGGYGNFMVSKSKRIYMNAHRFSYIVHRGEIPKGLTVDHLCRNKLCVNPWHMEIVTIWENTLRGTGCFAVSAKVTQCPKGHPYTEENTYHRPDKPHKRDCKTCRRDRGYASRRYRASQ